MKDELVIFSRPKANISEDIFDTIEEAKQSIENNIADYDNVKLEEIEIPEVLK